MAYLLVTPSVREGPAGGGPLFSRYKIPRGISLLVFPGCVVTEVRYPSEDQLAAAEVAYIGGHEYIVDGEDAQCLLDAGYGHLMTPDFYGDIYVDPYDGGYV
jgi:hypothetical protein